MVRVYISPLPLLFLLSLLFFACPSALCERSSRLHTLAKPIKRVVSSTGVKKPASSTAGARWSSTAAAKSSTGAARVSSTAAAASVTSTRSYTSMGTAPAASYSSPGAPSYSSPGAPSYSSPGAPSYSSPGAPSYSSPGAPSYSSPGAPSYSSPGVASYSSPGVPSYSSPGVASVPSSTGGAASDPNAPWGPGVVWNGVCTFPNITSRTQVQGTPLPFETTPPNTLIAFVGDVTVPRDPVSQGSMYNKTAELWALIRKEGAEAMVLAGDLDYFDCPGQFEHQLSQYLGPNYPVFTVVGNHDEPQWNQYSALIAARWKRAGITTCNGTAGTQQVCTYKGITIVQTAPGCLGHTIASGYIQKNIIPFMNSTLTTHASRFQICSWHKNQKRMQLGTKSDEVGWGVYELCREHGAFIATGHEHSYARTYLLSNMTAGVLANVPNANATYLPLARGTATTPGVSAAFVNGLGGHSTRSDSLCTTAGACPWWAAKYHSLSPDGSNSALALFCNFNHQGNPNLAYCYAKDVKNIIRDSFYIDVTAKAPQ